ncbi:hypothetical protein HYZ05_00050 [Candidatus Daviesbacteria bacterium]|nr:hypothetical protein [Candidatus Daviesbacteria bacterium]
MTVYKEAVSSSKTGELTRRFGGTDDYSITPLFALDTPKQAIPDNLAALLTNQEYPLVRKFYQKIGPAIAIIDQNYSDATLEDRVNAFIGLLFTVGFHTSDTKPTGHRNNTAERSLSSLAALFSLSVKQVSLRRNAVIDNARFGIHIEYMEADYLARLKKSPKQK